jgi:hypothetical protein
MTKETIRNGSIRDEDIRALVDTVLAEDDVFYVPPHIIPDGFSVEWKLLTILGQRMPNQNSRDARLAKTKWEPVSLAAHPSFRALVSKDYQGDSVENEGMILMIRPKEITEKVKQIQKYKADAQLQNKLKQVGETGSGEAPRAVQVVKRSYEPNIEVQD